MNPTGPCALALARKAALAGCAALLLACSGGSDPPVGQGGMAVEGVVQKGPPMADTVIRVRTLGAMLDPVAQSGEAPVAGLGRYSTRIDPAGSYIEVTSTGLFFDEIAGAASATRIGLRALVPLDTRSGGATTVNVNLLTTLVAARAEALLRADFRSADAFTRAEGELNGLFPFAAHAGAVAGFHQLDLLQPGTANAYGLLVSLLLLQAAHDSGMTAEDWLQPFTADFADNGQLDDAGRAAALPAARDHLDARTAIESLRSYCAGLGVTVVLDDVAALANRAPLANAGSPTVVLVGETVQLDASSSRDPDGDALTYAWHLRRNQNDGPYENIPLETFTLDGRVATFLPRKTASYDVTLTVTDPFGLSHTATTTAIARHTFRANGDGTVTNLQTGLMWQQQDDGNLYTMSEATGRSYLGIANENNGLQVCFDLVLAGYDNWRTPRLGELEGLRDFTFAAPRIDHDAFPGSKTSAYLADAWAPNTQANFVEFAEGMVLRTSMFGRYPLRCVRS